MPYYQDNLIWWYKKDCRDMSELPDGCVQMACTSPPYWGLRKYSGLPDLIWGDAHYSDLMQCNHQWIDAIKPDDAGQGHYTGRTRWQHIAKEAQERGIPVREIEPDAWAKGGFKTGFCSLCGAWKGSYGLEPTPEMYVQHTIEILREIRRVLRKDGVVFWNIGDSYQGGNRGASVESDIKRGDQGGSFQPHNIGAKGIVSPSRLSHPRIKPKDLCLIPFRVAIAAQEDGWWVRSVIIWSKPNPMPESVTDRPTESHEYILMLTKSGTTQYWTHRDGGGTRQRPKADYRWVNQLTNEEVTIEPADWKDKIACSDCNGTGKETAMLWGDYEVEIGKCPKCGGKGKVKLWRRINLWRGHDYYWDADAVREPAEYGFRDGGMRSDAYLENKQFNSQPYQKQTISGKSETGRNIRTVWEFPTQPYPEAHFAVFPEKLPEICIKAATPEVGCCSKCGAPWERITEDLPRIETGGTRKKATPAIGNPNIRTGYIPKETLGWQPTCKCNADKVPSIVLDPFLGSGTTLWVAKLLGRRGVGYELSEEYCALALERNRQMVLEL